MRTRGGDDPRNSVRNYCRERAAGISVVFVSPSLALHEINNASSLNELINRNVS